MSSYGFFILKLELTGGNIPSASVDFKKGLNVVTGASDTGKSFILQCIDYTLGAGSAPKKIEQAKDYECVHLIIQSNTDNKKYELTRNLDKGNTITIKEKNNNQIHKLNLNNTPNNNNTVSAFLLQLTGLDNKVVRKNTRNETVNLSFRDLAHLCIISEEKIITEGSPIITNYIQGTKEKSVFSLLLTGEDDSGLQAIEDKKITSVKKDAKIEVLQEIIENFSSIENQGLEDLDVESQIYKLNSHYKKLKEQITNLKFYADGQEKIRQRLWEDIQFLTSDLHTKNVLLERFKLLEKKYNSDLDRLNSIIEANLIFNDFPSVNCFFCGAQPKNQNHSAVEKYNANHMEEACLQEINSITILKNELTFTINDINESYKDLKKLKEEKEQELSLIEHEISLHTNPQIKNLLESIQITQEAIAEKKERLFHIKKIRYLEDRIIAFEQTKILKPLSTKNNDITEEINLLCKEVETRVENWQLFENPKVAFNKDRKVWDITISGKSRNSYGKGFRALTYTAFTLSILKYCIKEKKPHPSFVIIDSPLVVFKEPDPVLTGKENSIKYNFFSDILENFNNEQVIIFENEDVPKDLESQINLIKFSKNLNIGRYGFIPVK